MRLSPNLAVAREFLRALGGALLLPLRVPLEIARARGLREEIAADLHAPAPIDEPRPVALPDRPLRLFIACAEASGETHAVNLVRELKRLAAESGAPAPELFGTGGSRLEAEGVELLGRPVDRAAMGFEGVFKALPYYLGLLRNVRRAFHERQPDVVVPVDSPALHVPLAHLARGAGVPTCHFVAPQYWGWASWRARGYRKAIDLALTILPFEKAWFQRRGVVSRHIGHPLLDELTELPTRSAPAQPPRIAVLPGSRSGVVRRNLPWMLDVLARVRESVPDLEARILQSDHGHEELVRENLRSANCEDWAKLCSDDLHQELENSSAAFAVSGTVLTDLLHHRLPTVVIYALSKKREVWMQEKLLLVPYFASTNLLAARELLPEFAFHGEGPREETREALVRALTDETARKATRDGLEQASDRLGPAGAARRAAGFVLQVAVEGPPTENPRPGIA